ncbi:MAG: hypothetical protein R3Y65_03250 [Bacillota bacterium]
MQNNMKKQRNAFFLFAAISLLVFVFSLYFMTDYQDLFGLVGNRYTENKLVADFHDDMMQPANQIFFKFGVVAILTAVFAMLMEVRTKVADKFALIVLCVLFAVLIGSAIYNLLQVTSLYNVYDGLDTSWVDDEGGTAHIRKYTAFYVGWVVYALQIISTALLGFIMAKNHFGFLKLAKQAEVEA